MIVVDYRERGSGVPEALIKLGSPLEFKSLDVGDYLVSSDVCIERKSSNDLVSSIIDKRLFEQVRRLKRAYGKPVLIVEGGLAETLRFRRVSYPQVYGALAAVMSMGVTVLSTTSYLETARVIYCLYTLSAGTKGRVSEQLPLKSVKRDGSSIEVVQLNMVASIPGIDRELAERILQHFRTPRRFFKATPSELRRIKGLGHARIAKIIEILDTLHPHAEKCAG
ncbi:MAG: ERCC4 domain-containing protein [Thermofilaceae archaeon]